MSQTFNHLIPTPRSSKRFPPPLTLTAVCLTALAVSGCEMTASQRTGEAQITAATKPLEFGEADAEPTANDPSKANGPDANSRLSQERVVPFFGERPDIVFNDTGYLDRMRANQSAETAPPSAYGTGSSVITPRPELANRRSESDDPDAPDAYVYQGNRGALNTPSEPQTPRDRDAIFDQTQQALAAAEAEAWDKAIDLAAVSAARGQATLPAEALQGLSGKQQRQLKSYHELLLRLGQDLKLREAPYNPDAILAAADQATQSDAGDGYVQITDLQLCRSVRGFGQYETLTTDKLLAGRVNPMVIYTELDGFHNKLLSSGDFETRVSQQVRLYHAADDLIVWEQPAQVLADTALKARRDFFLVQTVSLPANLGPGKYLLKVTVVDHHSDTMWEESKELNVVTQAKLVSADRSGWGDTP